MPRSFQFKRLDGSNPTLNGVDAMICADTNQPCSSTDYSVEYQILTWIGLCMLMRYGGFVIDEDTVTLWILDHATSASMARLYYDYLGGHKLSYEAWG